MKLKDETKQNELRWNHKFAFIKKLFAENTRHEENVKLSKQNKIRQGKQ